MSQKRQEDNILTFVNIVTKGYILYCTCTFDDDRIIVLKQDGKP